MEGLVWCMRLIAAGVPLALLGLWLDSEKVMALGGGAVATALLGWPALMLLGAFKR